MEAHDISATERRLVAKLRLLCNKNGNETDPIKSVPIFHKLAKIYESKTKNKKLSSIRSVALLNAAIVRDSKNQQIKSDLQKYCSAVLVKAKAQNLDADLVEISRSLRQKLFKERKDLAEDADKIEKIPNDAEGDELLALERKKVRDIQELQNKVTKTYTQLMKFVSDECITIMGEPPCEYSLVAMGSLARAEITLYSDLEHMIVLENDSAQREGETILNGVAIPTLTPKYRDWFNDNITPNGVAFDGMVAHACKIPLGREPTAGKNRENELIKTVDEMLEYLKPDYVKKEGYHLGDMLSKTCYISGDKVTFDEYQQKSKAVATRNDKESNFSDLYKQLNEDLQNLSILKQHYGAFVGSQSFNVKRVIYRSATIFMSAIGRLHSMNEASCFDIIDKLEKDEICGGKVAHELRFMVALACEIRFKIYHSKGYQDDIIMQGSEYTKIVDGLIKIVGERSFVTLMATIHKVYMLLNDSLKDMVSMDLNNLLSLKYTFRAELFILQQLPRFANDLMGEIAKLDSTVQPCDVGIDSCLFALEILRDRGEHKLCLDLCAKIISLCRNDFEIFSVKADELRCNIGLGRCEESDVQSQIDVLNNLMIPLVKSAKTEYQGSKALYEYARCLQGLGRDFDAINAWEKCLQFNEQFEETPLSKYTNNSFKTMILMSCAMTLMKVQHHDEARVRFSEALEIMNRNNPKTDMHMSIYYFLVVCYLGMKKHYKAFIYCFEFVKVANEINEPLDPLKIKFIRSVCKFLIEEFSA